MILHTDDAPLGAPTLSTPAWCVGERSATHARAPHTHCAACAHRWDGAQPGDLVASPAQWHAGPGGRPLLVCEMWRAAHDATVAQPGCQVCDISHPPVSGGNRSSRLGMALCWGLLLLAATLPALAAGPVCDWTEPGSNPTGVDAATAIGRLPGLPDDVRVQLQHMARHGYGWRQVVVRRDSIDGGALVDLRDMTFGPQGRVCVGAVDRSRWPADRVERGLVYQVGPYAVVWMSVCRNVARVTDTTLPAPVVTAREAHAARIRSAGQAGGSVGPGLRMPAQSVPEPSTAALLAAAVGVLVWMRKRTA